MFGRFTCSEHASSRSALQQQAIEQGAPFAYGLHPTTHSSCCSCTALRLYHLTRSPSVSTKGHFPVSHGITSHINRPDLEMGLFAVLSWSEWIRVRHGSMPSASHRKVRKAAVCRRILYCSLVWTHACDALRDISIVQHSLTTTTS